MRQENPLKAQPCSAALRYVGRSAAVRASQDQMLRRDVRLQTSLGQSSHLCETAVSLCQRRHFQRWIRADPPLAKARTCSTVAIVVSPGKVVRSAP